MKKFLITGCVKCGHKVFSLEKRISAATAADAVQIFKANFPNAKNDSFQSFIKNLLTNNLQCDTIILPNQERN